MSDEKLKLVFNSFDTDGSGQISREELTVALKKGGKAVTNESVQALLLQIDKDSDGQISFDEYKSIFKLSPDALPFGVMQLVDVSKSVLDTLGSSVVAPITRMLSKSPIPHLMASAEPVSKSSELTPTELAVFDDVFCAKRGGVKLAFKIPPVHEIGLTKLQEEGGSAFLPQLVQYGNAKKVWLKVVFEKGLGDAATIEQKRMVVDADGNAIFSVADTWDEKSVWNVLKGEKKLAAYYPDGTPAFRISNEGLQLSMKNLAIRGLKTRDGSEVDLLVKKNMFKLQNQHVVYVAAKGADGKAHIKGGTPIARISEPLAGAMVDLAAGAVGAAVGMKAGQLTDDGSSLFDPKSMLIGTGVGIATGIATAAATVGLGKAGEQVAKTDEDRVNVASMASTIREVEVAAGVDVALVMAILLGLQKIEDL